MNKRVLPIVMVLVVGSALSCGTLHPFTKKDVVELSKAGVGEDVVIRRIEATPGGFDLSSSDIIALKGSGVSNRVLAAMVRSRREYPLHAPVFHPQINDLYRLYPWAYEYGYWPYAGHPAPTLTKRQIIAMVKAGVGDEAILEQLESTGAAFDLSADDLIELKQAEVSERVIKAMIHPGERVTYQYVPMRSPFPSYFYPPYSAVRASYGYPYSGSVRRPRMYRSPVEQPDEGEGREGR